MSNTKIPDGKRGSVAVKDATTEQLKGFIAWQKRQFDDGKVQERYAAQNEIQLADAERELERRMRETPEPKTQAIVALGRAIHDPVAVTQQLTALAAQCHLIGPQTAIDVLPPGCGVAISFVQVNPETCYPVGNSNLGISGADLKKIGMAAGIVWDVIQSKRLDDAKDQNYCHYRAVGHYRLFDGSIGTVTGEVEIDMREGSNQLNGIKEKAQQREDAKKAKAASEKKAYYPGDLGEGEIREMRKFILRHAQTKAKLRAITDLGIRRAYTRDELSKPFAIARLTWTGETDDPVLKREFARATANSFIAGSSVLYGRQESVKPRATPALNEKPAAYDDFSDTWDEFDTFGEPVDSEEVA